MAVDRGGLEYTITVRNRFSQPLQRFRTDLAAGRRAFTSFKQAISSLNIASKGISNQLRSAGTAAKTFATKTKAASVASRDQARALRDQEAAVRRLSATERGASTRRRTREIRNQITQTKSLTRTTDRLARAQTRVGRSGRTAAAGLRRSAAGARRTQAAFGGLLLTTRRLATTLLFFSAARLAIEAIFTGITAPVKFAASLETAELGLASLLLATSQITDAQGVQLKGQEALTEAQKISENQLAKLRIEALKTSSTFDQLAKNFQIAFAPAQAAGFTVDEARKFTVQVSQAAAAVGVEQRQLSEELRSLLTGKIRRGQSRLADALDISSKEILKAREAGTLVEFLQEKLEAFTVAGEKVLGTFAAQVTNAKDALLLLASAATGEFFKQLKGFLDDIRLSSATINENLGRLEINQEVVDILEEIFGSLGFAVEQARALGRELSLVDLKNIAEAIGALIRTLAVGLSGAITGASRGLSDVIDLMKGVVQLVTDISGESLIGSASVDEAREMTAQVTRLTVVAGGALLIFGALAVTGGLISALLASTAISLAAASGQAQILLDSLIGVENVNLADIARLFEAELVGAFDKIEVTFNARLRQSLNFVVALAKRFSDTLGNVLADLGKRDFAGAAAEVKKAFDGAIEDTRKSSAEIDSQLQTHLNFIDRIVRANKNLLKETRNREETQKRINDLLEKSSITVAKGIRESIKSTLDFFEFGLDAILADFGVTDIKLGIDKDKIKKDIEDAVGSASAKGNLLLRAVQDPANLREQARLQDEARLAAERHGNQIKIITAFYAKFGIESEQALRESINLQSALTQNLSGSLKASKKFAESLGFKFKIGIDDSDLEEDVLDALRIVQESLTSSAISNQGNLAPSSVGGVGGVEVVIPVRLGISDPDQLSNFFTGIFDELLFREEQGEAINSFSNFLDAISDLIDDFFSSTSLKQLGFSLLQGILGGGLGAPGGSIATSGGRGFHKGGKIRSSSHRPSPAHAFAGGFAHGGRPSGLHHTDRIPIWAGLDEYMIKAKAAKGYGYQAMDAINNMRVDPMALRALTGASSSRRARTAVSHPSKAPQGFAAGGQVTSVSGGGDSSGGLQPAVIVPNEQSLDRLLRGGTSAFMRFMQANSGRINSALGRR